MDKTKARRCLSRRRKVINKELVELERVYIETSDNLKKMQKLLDDSRIHLYDYARAVSDEMDRRLV